MMERIPFQEELEDFEELAQQGIECLNLIIEVPQNLDDTGVLIATIRDAVDVVREGEADIPNNYEDFEEIAFALGTLWGDVVCRTSDWEWVYLEEDNGYEGWAITSNDRSYACYPHHLVLEILYTQDRENNLVSLFNMIDNSILPPASPGDYIIIG